MDLFEQFASGKDCPLSCEKYQLKPNEVISEDGGSIVCRDCGEVRRVRIHSNLYQCDIWTSARPDDTCLCSCDRKKALEESKKRDYETFMRIYDCEQFRSWVGDRYINVNLEDLSKKDDKKYDFALKACKRYVDNCESVVDKGHGIYIYSRSSGTGKTTLMAGVRNALIKKQVKCVFINAKDLANEAIRRNGEDYTNTVYNYSMFFRVPVLIIDDIAATKLNDDRYGTWMNSVLYELIERRCRNKLSTCFTSNYSPKQLQEKRGVDFKTVDRINELSSLIIELEGESIRGEYKNKDTNAREEKE